MLDFLKKIREVTPTLAHEEFVDEEVSAIATGLRSSDKGERVAAGAKLAKYRNQWGGQTVTGKTHGQSGEILTRLMAKGIIDEINTQ
jgi:hypothetical protein